MSTSKFMTSQPDLQTIAMHILPNFSQIKGNQTMKFGQLIKYNMRGRLVPDFFLFFKKVQYEVKVSGPQLSFNILQ